MIADRVAAVRERIARAADRAGRSAGDVTLVAVSKAFPAEAIREAFAAGLRDFGENKVQEAEEKIAGLHDLRSAGARFHFVGHLQGNKAKRAVPLFDSIHSVDSEELARRLARMAEEQSISLHVLVQVDLAGEATKHGVEEAGLLAVLEAVRGVTHLHPDGLMILPPFADDPEASRPHFRRLRELRDLALSRDLLQGSCRWG